MSTDVEADAAMKVALYQQAVADVIAVVGTALEADEAGADMGTWIADQTEHWTREHGRAGVMIIGLMLPAAGLDPLALAAIGRALIHGKADG